MATSGLPGSVRSGAPKYPPSPKYPQLMHSPHRPPQPQQEARRRPNQQQGRALEVLGHAVEYLVDTRMTRDDMQPLLLAGPDLQAVQILMRLNRAVFSSCEEIVPLRRRLKQWLLARLIGA